jgi:hypothetical protein
MSTAMFLLALGTSLPAQEAQEELKTIDLFASGDLADWDYFLKDPDVKKTDVWSFDDGVLYCKGEPMGYLATKEEFKNFKLSLQWRWPEEPSNSGVLMRISGEPMPLPHCVEAQLKSGSAGDLWGFQGFWLDGGEGRTNKRENSPTWGISKLMENEVDPGEWNTYDILVKDGLVVLAVNGKIVNWTVDAKATPGAVGLQSEGGPIEFRNFHLTPLP